MCRCIFEKNEKENTSHLDGVNLISSYFLSMSKIVYGRRDNHKDEKIYITRLEFFTCIKGISKKMYAR